jgi:hypothetical protein
MNDIDEAVPVAGVVTPQACAACDEQAVAAVGETPAAYVYAIGRIEARFPNLSVEKEFAQAIARTENAGRTDSQVFHGVLSRRENRYLARQMCWVLTVQALDTYLLSPNDPADLDLLIEAIRPAPSAENIDVVIGARAGMAPPALCDGLMVPRLAFEHVYSFDRTQLIDAIPRPEGTDAALFGPAAEELFDRIMLMTDNAGATDEHRALNYLAMRYPPIYAKAADAFARDCALTGVEVRPSALSRTRRIVDVIFTFTHRNTDFVEKSFVRCDMSGLFPFLITKLSPYYER